MTHNLFDNAKFGDMFLTAENKQAVFLRIAENAEYKFAILYIEDWGTVQVFRHNGKEIYNDAAHSIISKQEVPVSEDKMTIRKEWFEHCRKSWYNEGYIDGTHNRDRQFKEPVSEELEEAADNALSDVLNTHEIVNVRSCLEMFRLGSKWKEQQFEKERLKHCDELTKEQAQVESDFVTQHLKEANRTPTFIDAIEYGMKLQNEQMMAKAIDAHCFGFQGAALFSFRLPVGNYLVGSEVKVIVMKED